MNTTVNGFNISYPDLGFAFNPIRVFVGNYPSNTILTLESNSIKIERETNNNHDLSFDLSAIARSLFNRFEFYKVEEVDTTLIKTLSFTLSNSNGVFYTGSIPIIWGALQIGETYTQNKTLTYFPGFPFTVPLYVQSDVVLKANDEEFKTIAAGKHNLDISGIDATGKIVISVFTSEYYKIQDFTFDFTFGPERVLNPKGLDIQINIADCPSDGVYLRWINKHGEYNYYLFRSSVISSEVKNIDIAYDSLFYTTDLTDNYHLGTGKNIGKSISESQKLFASLIDSNTFGLLMGLVESPVVDMFFGYDSDNNPKWISISIADGTFTQTTAHLQDFEIYLIPNKKQVQTL